MHSENGHLSSARDTKNIRLIDEAYLSDVKRFLEDLKLSEHTFLLADEIKKCLDSFVSNGNAVSGASASAMQRLFRGCQELFFVHDYAYAMLRPKIGEKRCVRLHPEGANFELVDNYHYLRAKDTYVQGYEQASLRGLVLDFAPFFRGFPRTREPGEMGEGISFLNRSLSGQMYTHPDKFGDALVRFLQSCSQDAINMLANDHLTDVQSLETELEAVRRRIDEFEPDTPYDDIAHDLRIHGFERGWGATAKDVAENLKMLARVIESPDPYRFETLLRRLPLIRNILLVSPHGWFGQEDVLGRPDTGGQVTYVLDQARAVERSMKEHFERAGVPLHPRIVILTRLIPDAENTSCNVPREKVHGSDDCWIVRVPFRDQQGDVLDHWVSRFKIWPYLETFAEESKSTILSEFMGKPDLIIGHYSDGNLVAHLLAGDLGVTHCAAAHALEKTKYLFSDLHWSDFEHDYNFSLHFTADLIAYNAADFIITSTYREIGGTNTEMGMFESYELFSMPGLYRVVQGLNPSYARFNIVPPGASEELFFPYTRTEHRFRKVTEKLKGILFNTEPTEDALGVLENPDLPPIFTMARIDKVKNLTGLVELYGKSETLRNSANLIILSSIIHPEESDDVEEREEAQRLHELIEQYGLWGHIRWIGARLNKVETGEIYRLLADRGGVFAQPALMETFGLTVIESMACGLPVVVTCFGGPSEIVVNGVSGEIVDPNDYEAFAAALERTVTDQNLWEERSKAGIERVESAYTWRAHAERILGLANVYSYWNYLDVMSRNALYQYVHTMYHAVYRPRAERLLEHI